MHSFIWDNFFFFFSFGIKFQCGVAIPHDTINRVVDTDCQWPSLVRASDQRVTLWKHCNVAGQNHLSGWWKRGLAKLFHIHHGKF